jgi:hypothetical protein
MAMARGHRQHQQPLAAIRRRTDLLWRDEFNAASQHGVLNACIQMKGS